MANTIRHKRGTGDPVAGDFSETAELLVNTSDGGLFTKTDGGSVVEIGGGGGGTVTSVDSGTGLTGGPITTSGTLSLADTAVTPGSYTVVSLTVDAQGRVTAASSGTAGISDTSSASTSVGLGPLALSDESLGSDNTAVGSGAAKSITTGRGNSAFGEHALANATTGIFNTIIGHDSSWGLSTGSRNTAVGYFSLRDCTNGGGNTAVGNDCLQNTTGSNNTAIGSQTGDQITSGSNNTCIGYEAQPSSATVSNEITLGSTGVSTLRCNVQTISSLSDGRDKTEVKELPEGLEFISNLKPVKFKWQTRDGNTKDGTYEAGFIAQDLQSAQTASNADYLGLVMDENPERLEASYGKLVPMLVKAIQELKSEVEQLKAKADA